MTLAEFQANVLPYIIGGCYLYMWCAGYKAGYSTVFR